MKIMIVQYQWAQALAMAEAHALVGAGVYSGLGRQKGSFCAGGNPVGGGPWDALVMAPWGAASCEEGTCHHSTV